MSPGSISIPSGQRSGSATITITDDSAGEETEYFIASADLLPPEAFPDGDAVYTWSGVRVDINDNDWRTEAEGRTGMTGGLDYADSGEVIIRHGESVVKSRLYHTRMLD